jgi:hypothetical protein
MYRRAAAGQAPASASLLSSSIYAISFLQFAGVEANVAREGAAVEGFLSQADAGESGVVEGSLFGS